MSLEEEAIARSAGGNTAAGELFLAGNAKVARCGAGGEDYRAGFKYLIAHVELFNIALQLNGVDDFHAQIRAKAD